MSSSRDQINFTGVPGICLAIATRLLHEVVGGASAEAAAERHLVDVAFVDRQAGSLGQRG